MPRKSASAYLSKGTLDEFVAWFKRKKNKSAMMDMQRSKGQRTQGENLRRESS